MKDNLARQLDVHTAFQETGTVVSVAADGLRVRSGQTEVDAARAASCLLEPAVGDLVLVVHHRSGTHVLAVLTRDDTAAACLSFDGDVELRSPGIVTLRGEAGVKLETPTEISIKAELLTMAAKQGKVALGVLEYAGDALSAQVRKLKTVAETAESTAGRLIQRLDRAYRFIAKSEVVKAEYLQFEAKKAFHVKADTTVLTSASLTKVDGAQIHLG